MSIFTDFNNHGLGNTVAFEEMCCQLFEVWGKRTLVDEAVWTYRKIRGSGGDGGIEAYWHKDTDGSWVGIQAKWFTSTLDSSKFGQILDSIDATMKLRPSLAQYIVCIPHDLTSMKGGRNGKPTIGEDEKWDNFAADVHEKYPALKLNLWTASTLQAMLAKPENEGCKRFWFEKSAINPEAIIIGVEKTTSALRGRYIPALTNDGDLSSFLDRFYGSRESRLQFLKDIDTSIAVCDQIITATYSLLEIEKDVTDQLRDVGNKAIQALSERIAAFEHLRATASLEPIQLIKFEDHWQNDSAIYEFAREIQELKERYKQPHHTQEILELTEKYEYTPSYWGLTHTMSEAFSSPHCLVTGSQGTGKTCGLASKANDYLGSWHHIPILIQASKVGRNATWRDVIAGALGLGADWDEISIWQALSANAALYDTCDEQLYIRAKVAIFVDGLDELPPADDWVVRIREADAITEHYPRIRFTYSTRPQGISTKGNHDIDECAYPIDDDGDVPVYELFDFYMDHYGIDVNGNEHYRWLLKTPMELSMFSQAHRGERLSGDISTNLTSLVDEELERLDKEFLARNETQALINRQPVRRALLALAAVFMQDRSALSADETKDIIERSCGNMYDASNMIAFLTSYGILDRRDERGRPPFGTDIVSFLPGSRHLWDYFMARMLIDGDDIAAASYIKSRPDAATMYGILLVELRGKLPVDCDELVAIFGKERAR